MAPKSSPDTMTAVAKRISDLIAASGTAPHLIAPQIRIDPSRLAEALAGTRTFTSLDLALIAEHFDVTVDWLLTGQDPWSQICLCRVPTWA